MFIVYVGTKGEVLVADQVDSGYCYSSERPRVLSTEQRCSSALPSSGAGSCIVSEYRSRVEDEVTLIVPPSPTLLCSTPQHMFAAYCFPLV